MSALSMALGARFGSETPGPPGPRDIDEAGDSIARFGTLALSSPFSSLSTFIFRPVDQPSLGNNLNQRLLSFYATPTRNTRYPDRHSGLASNSGSPAADPRRRTGLLSFTEPANHSGSRYQKQAQTLADEKIPHTLAALIWSGPAESPYQPFNISTARPI
jgi:hypothetical protein